MQTFTNTKLDLTGRTITINGKEFPVTLKLHCDYDEWITIDDYVNDCDGNTDEERAEMIRKLETDQAQIAVIGVIATFKDFQGTDFLSGCWIEGASDVDDMINEHGMIDNAVAELQTNVNDFLKAVA